MAEYSYDKVVEGLGLSRDEFIDLCILMGCDYCPTIKGEGGGDMQISLDPFIIFWIFFLFFSFLFCLAGDMWRLLFLVCGKQVSFFVWFEGSILPDCSSIKCSSSKFLAQ